MKLFSRNYDNRGAYWRYFEKDLQVGDKVPMTTSGYEVFEVQLADGQCIEVVPQNYLQLRVIGLIPENQ